jgi:hypothetical protein
MKSFRTRTKVVANAPGYNFGSCLDLFGGRVRLLDTKEQNFAENEPQR